MSSYHPEEWQPAWGIRTMLEALISFMPSPGDGALGALDASAEIRAKLAKESLSYTHAQMPELPELGSCKYVKGKDVSEALTMLSMKAKVDEEEQEEVVKESPPPTPAQEPVPQQQPVEEVVTVAEVQVPRDSVDEFLKAASWGILLALFVLVYRKLLVAYAPEM